MTARRIRQNEAVTIDSPTASGRRPAADVDADQAGRSAEAAAGAVRYASEGRVATLHPLWLRHESHEPGQIDPVNRQRLFTPQDVALDLTVNGCELRGQRLSVTFSDGHTAELSTTAIDMALGWVHDPEAPPVPVAWVSPLDPFPYIDWSSIGWAPAESDVSTVIEFLRTFFTHGYVVLRNTPVETGTVRRICDRLGYIVGNNFGWTFDVRAEPVPTDLAYTSVALLAHTDQPYRQPVPGIQLLHCLRNEAPGGDSTLADGLAAAEALRQHDPEAFAACTDVDVVFRYDMVTDTVVGHGPLIELDSRGRFRRIHLNTKLDTPVPPIDGDLDAWYRGRRWLTDWLNDPAHQVTFRLEPGDVMFMDNHRVLHGRTSFDASAGYRHLQGAYIDHDGPDTMYRLAVRSLT
jgi:gamma-butyrobetaine dioxygenase